MLFWHKGLVHGYIVTSTTTEMFFGGVPLAATAGHVSVCALWPFVHLLWTNQKNSNIPASISTPFLPWQVPYLTRSKMLMRGIQDPDGGSLDWIVVVAFENGVEWIFRSPHSGRRAFLSESMTSRLLASEVATLKYVKSHSSVPVPEVLGLLQYLSRKRLGCALHPHEQGPGPSPFTARLAEPGSPNTSIVARSHPTAATGGQA
ncbi:hypothetical protein VTK26DRAFT_2019 [Humicola hyalothermophila]